MDICGLFLGLIYLLQVFEMYSKSLDDPLEIDEEDKWLENESNYDLDYIGDSPRDTGLILEDDVRGNDDECSPLPDLLITNACKAKVCNNHGDCRRKNRRCCFNGCVKTCLKQRSLPPFIDWIKEPRPRTSSGVSWLVNGPTSSEDVETCSTTPVGKDEDPLLCPHGYVCHVIKKGNKKKGIPNVGYCVPEADHEMLKGRDKEQKITFPSSCLVDNYVLLNGAFLYLRGQKCVCKDGYLTCLNKKT